MKRFLSILAALILAAGCATSATAALSVTPGTPVHTHSDANTGGGTLNLSGALSSTKACATGYTRLAPNYCYTTSISYVLRSVNACTAVAVPAAIVAAGGKALALLAVVRIHAANVVNTYNTGSFTVYPDAACSFSASEVSAGVMEFVATASTVLIGQSSGIVKAPIISGNYYYAFGFVNSSASDSIVAIAGYYD